MDLSNYRWTLDTVEDLEFMRTIYNTLYSEDDYIRTADVLELLAQEPGIALINSHIKQKTI